MNVNMFRAVSNKNSFLSTGNLPMMQKSATKSAQEKGMRQQKAAEQIEFWENQKENLKNMECSTVEEIAKKLEKLQSYEDGIAAAKIQYNQEQMWHLMDEAKEAGEKIAEKAEELEPKTAEERKEEMVEEALGTDEGKGVITEILEEITQVTEELTEEAAEMELQDELSEERLEETDRLSDAVTENVQAQEQSLIPPSQYKRIDLRA